MKKTVLIGAILLAIVLLWKVSGLQRKLHPFNADQGPGSIGSAAKADSMVNAICDESILVGSHHPSLRAWVPYYAGQLAEMAGMRRAAIRKYTEAIGIDPDAAGLYLKRGNLMCAAGNSFGAVADYGRAISRDPRYAEAYFNRGVTNWMLADFYRGEARTDIQKAADLGLSDAKIWIEIH